MEDEKPIKTIPLAMDLEQDNRPKKPNNETLKDLMVIYAKEEEEMGLKKSNGEDSEIEADQNDVDTDDKELFIGNKTSVIGRPSYVIKPTAKRDETATVENSTTVFVSSFLAMTVSQG